ERLFESLKDLQPEERKKLLGGLLPLVVAELNKPVPQQQGMSTEEQKVIDLSVPFKDAAFGLLIYDKAALVTEDEHKAVLKDALLNWIQADFSRRIAISSQLFGVDQILRFYKEDGAKILPPLIKEDSAYDRIATLVTELGTPETKELASRRLVELAKITESKAWFDKMKPVISENNKAQGYNPTEAQLVKQVTTFQEEQIAKVYASLKKVRGRSAVDYLLAVAADKSRSVKVRQVALAALEGALDRNSAADASAIVKIATAEDTPDEVRDLAFVRVSEMPREGIAKNLFEMFPQKDDAKWKLRWVAAATLLKMSSAKDVPEFLQKLPPNPAQGFAMSEPLEYGKLIGTMNPPVSKDLILADLKNPSLAVKLTAIGYFYHFGKAADLPVLAPLGEDRTALPKTTDPDAKWQCSTPKAGGKPGETEAKGVTTVGEFVKLCVEPRLQAAK
ncbi:MAG: hypothetical protein RMJ98_13025, partial [Myxococcales bacterium]|nr:hypothetical protein [Myxococcales bacterium]